MKKFLLLIIIVLFSGIAFAQRFQQYNAGTLFGSFENPSQAAFIPDSSRRFAFNFFIPNLYANTYLQGNAQASLKSRWFIGNYDNSKLQIGQSKSNIPHADVNIYVLAFKVFASLDGKQEVGFSYQIRGNGRGNVTDENVAIFNGSLNFNQPSYTDVFNSHASYETFHQFSGTYREQVTKNFSVGVKLSALFGISYNRLDIDKSAINFYNNYNQASWALAGSFRSNYLPGQYNVHEQLESIQNPGAAISLGTTYKSNNGIIVQANLRDLGFVHWRYGTFTDYFNSFYFPVQINGLKSARRETNVSNSFNYIISNNLTQQSFNVPITGYADLSVAKKFDFDNMLHYTPTLIVSKQTFSQNLGGALVNQVQYGPASVSLSGIYNYKLFDLGLQLMFKTPNAEFFVGSEQLTRSFNIIQASRGNATAASQSGAYSGAGAYLGFSLKLGKKLQRWKGETYIPGSGEQGPLGRAWSRLFNSKY